MTLTGHSCFLCDQPATAVWYCESGATLAACPACAVDVLPRLISDAVYVGERSAMERTADAIMAAYWHGIALRLLRDRDSTPEAAA
jgi:hypothetical protein